MSACFIHTNPADCDCKAYLVAMSVNDRQLPDDYPLERIGFRKGAYYNENDPKAAAWLRELIKAGLIAKGEVDERSISDVRGSDLAGFTQCHFFAGIGGWSYALRLAGWPDTEPVWTGSCPCQPFSQAGKGAGESDKRHLWPDFRRLIEECSPPAVFGEQVASKAGRGWLNGVRTDLEAMAYEVGAADLCSAGVGAPHIRQRLYWVANAGYERTGRPARSGEAEIRRPFGDASRRGDDCAHCNGTGKFPNGNKCYCCDGRGWREPLRLGDSDDPRSQGRRIDAGEYADQRAAGAAGSIGGVAVSDGRQPGNGGVQRSGKYGQQPAECGSGFWGTFDIVHCTDNKARRIEPGTFPLAHGIPARMGRLRGYGNAITPEVAAEFVTAFCEATA